MKNIRVDIAIKEANREKRKAQDGTNSIESPFVVPISPSITSFSFGTVAMGSRHIGGETTFIQVDDILPLKFIDLYFYLKTYSGDFVGFWVKQSFFYY